MTKDPLQWQANGVVIAVNGSGPASSITYDVSINLPNNPTRTFHGVTPFRPRWPDTIDTVPAPAGTVVKTAWFGKTVYFDIPELPATMEQSCP
jgi:hypothetical protein